MSVETAELGAGRPVACRRALTPTVAVGGRPVCLGSDAVDRYWQRVKPAWPDSSAAARDLQRVVASCSEIRIDCPPWAAERAGPKRASTIAWLWLGPDVALPLVRSWQSEGAFFTTTCLVRGSRSDAERARRATRRRDRRVASRHSRQAGSTLTTRELNGRRRRREAAAVLFESEDLL
jgi:hypothetical protein